MAFLPEDTRKSRQPAKRAIGVSVLALLLVPVTVGAALITLAISGWHQAACAAAAGILTANAFGLFAMVQSKFICRHGKVGILFSDALPITAAMALLVLALFGWRAAAITAFLGITMFNGASISIALRSKFVRRHGKVGLAFQQALPITVAAALLVVATFGWQVSVDVIGVGVLVDVLLAVVFVVNIIRKMRRDPIGTVIDQLNELH